MLLKLIQKKITLIQSTFHVSLSTNLVSTWQRRGIYHETKSFICVFVHKYVWRYSDTHLFLGSGSINQEKLQSRYTTATYINLQYQKLPLVTMLSGFAYNHIPQRLSVPIIFFFSAHNLIRLSSMDFLWRSGKLVVIEMKNMWATYLHIIMFHYEMLKLKKFFNHCFLLFECLLLLRQKPSLTFLFIL